jgi:hypothetical protein
MTAKRMGIWTAGLHLLVFAATIAYVYGSSEAQASLIWIAGLVIDFPISLLSVVFAQSYSAWAHDAGSSHGVLQQLLYPPYVIHGLVGTIWWYFLPRLVLPKKRGGVWGSTQVS